MQVKRLSIMLGVCALILGGTAASAEAQWTSKALKTVLPDGEETEEEDITLEGKILERDDEDEDGNAITRAFLEKDDGELIPLPCERKQGDGGMAKKMAGKATAGVRGAKGSCWDYVGQEVEILGKAQSIQKKAKRFRKLTKITGINPLG